MPKDSQKQSIGAIVKGLFVLAALAVICIVALSATINFVSDSIAALLSTLSTIDVAIVVALITGCVSIVTVIGGGIANNYLAYRQRNSEYLREHRAQAYEKLIEIVYKMLMKSKKKEQYSADEMLSDMNDFNQSLTLWGSSKAIRLWDEWRLATVGKQPSASELLFAMEKVLIQLRRDMGQGRGLKRGDLLKLFINDVDTLLSSSNSVNQ
ncbi:hypothetical protein [Enorma sp.]|uniref:hypothetical protein n=1 Tax=Enorma sp. TaxID=1920692 RepID=UPI0025BA58D1|nr:hypothetical protein [Enorma sp.]